jgi:7-cyano-7-deazaguanine synthase
VKRKYHVRSLTFEYHGIAMKEVESARALAKLAKVSEHRTVRLPDLREAGDIRGAGLVGMPSTYIPMRNSIFYSSAASFAEEIRADLIVGGHNKDDSQVFWDARPSFFARLEKALWQGSKILSSKRTRILLPLAEMTKAQVVRKAHQLKVPLGGTWSCHKDGEEHCWECKGCLARIQAFEEAEVSDPLFPPVWGKLLKPSARRVP